jgi:hypothetical protein
MLLIPVLFLLGMLIEQGDNDILHEGSKAFRKPRVDWTDSTVDPACKEQEEANTVDGDR